MYSEEDLIQLSALQHFVFCPRQCALIHIEQIWFENQFTAEGRIMHEDVHEEGSENRKEVLIERGIPLRSLELGLIGKADVVEFRKTTEGEKLPFPVEYKRGKPKPDDSDKVQLCAQAMCLEEMLKVRIIEGALFYGRTRHRLDVEFDDGLREKTKDTAARLHDFIRAGRTPSPEYAPRCKSCSFIDVCLPEVVKRNTSVERYLESLIREP